MDTLLHQIANGIIHQAMALHGREARKTCCHDTYCIMAAAFCAGMTGVPGTVVADLECRGAKLRQPFAQDLNGAHAGSTFLNGLTVTLA